MDYGGTGRVNIRITKAISNIMGKSTYYANFSVKISPIDKIYFKMPWKPLYIKWMLGPLLCKSFKCSLITDNKVLQYVAYNVCLV